MRPHLLSFNCWYIFFFSSLCCCALVSLSLSFVVCAATLCLSPTFLTLIILSHCRTCPSVWPSRFYGTQHSWSWTLPNLLCPINRSMFCDVQQMKGHPCPSISLKHISALLKLLKQNLEKESTSWTHFPFLYTALIVNLLSPQNKIILLLF